jgi:hypothetical protein
MFSLFGRSEKAEVGFERNTKCSRNVVNDDVLFGRERAFLIVNKEPDTFWRSNLCSFRMIS